jgi:hypothetical protein
MIDPLQNFAVAVWTGVVAFIATNIEPQGGVVVLAIFGAILSVFYGQDRPLGRLVAAFCLGLLIGVTASQIAAEVVALKSPFTRGAIAFVGALFGETVVIALYGAIKSGDFWRELTRLVPWRGKGP